MSWINFMNPPLVLGQKLLEGYFILSSLPFALGVLGNFLGILNTNKKPKQQEAPLSPGAWAYPSLDVDYLIANLLKDKKLVGIVRNHHLFEKHDFPCLWISKIEKENSVRPTHLEKILHWVTKTITHDHGLIFDGVEYLILENGFEPTFKFLLNLKDHILLRDSILVLVVDERTFEERQLSLLYREFRRISP
ncbi:MULTISPECIES: DUF835 domain-containing protein [Thermococcus]|uniref:DUF835 domain-containing protein n=3 Tax=Thermococcus sibiricus TaxID=172049 RepID=C6A1Q6_THESM|nr:MULTISPECIES: DUF835 domain-containing protein [Thermococcus]ACS89551.1 hypothetical protein TSIB_0485 [Thermococcus sibiricus MM 739]MBC7094772.1 DUF835 domain-containing protein [Thermococcus sp.]HII66480.1 DUF835 domain-containing protein [Thermococcaceae archaeon]